MQCVAFVKRRVCVGRIAVGCQYHPLYGYHSIAAQSLH